MGPVPRVIARALTIAGSDPVGGAGVQQDLRMFAALGVWGLSAITAVTSQDTAGVGGWHAMPPALVASQIAAVANDVGIDAAKTGMLAERAVVQAVADAVDHHRIEPLVVDPVLVSTTGHDLAEPGTLEAIRDLLVPRAALVTPNALEASRLTGIEVADRASQAEAARALRALGARAALVTGGHLGGDEVVDVLDDDEGEHVLRAPRIGAGQARGTGCMLSAAITANLAKGMPLREAVGRASALVRRALEGALALGKGGKVLDVFREGRGP